MTRIEQLRDGLNLICFIDANVVVEAYNNEIFIARSEKCDENIDKTLENLGFSLEFDTYSFCLE